MSRPLVIGSTIVLAAFALFFAWKAGWLGGDALFSRVKDQPEMAALYDKAQKGEEALAKDPEAAAKYFDVGLSWKSIAEQMQGDEDDRLPFFKRSLSVYERGIARFGQKNILFYLNAGNLAERIGDFQKAERYFRKAIEISPADESGYIELAELFSYKLNKGKEEILAIFNAGLKVMVDQTPLTQARAAYLRRIGDVEGALKDYELLAERFPSHQAIKQIISELRQSLR